MVMYAVLCDCCMRQAMENRMITNIASRLFIMANEVILFLFCVCPWLQFTLTYLNYAYV